MAALGPFEPTPRLAAAVSGGRDSLALLLLLHDWVAARGGDLLVLTVDHGLRAGAAGEARWVAGVCEGLGLRHRTLAWRPRERLPRGGLQAAARDARYRLLAKACRAEGRLHLLLGHHREDQAETLLLRLEAGSDLPGLAAMPAVAHLDDLRLLRPLLDQPRAALEALLVAAGQGWLDDPSNDDAAFARTRLRRRRPALEAAGLSPAACAEAAAGFAALRRWEERALARLLVECCRLDPRGFAWIDRPRLLAAPAPLARRALGRVLRCVAGRAHAPRGARLQALLERLDRAAPPASTLAGCRVLPRRGDRLLVVRETAAIAPAGPPDAWPASAWDGRFRLRAPAGDVTEGRAPPDVVAYGRLPADQQRRLRTAETALAALPAAARAGLPTLRDLDGSSTLPHFTARPGIVARKAVAAFQPTRALTVGSFAVLR